MSSNECAECVVTEYCPECETEVTMQWDVRALGYKAFCPHCGKRLMLCDECQNRKDGGFMDDCDYDSETDSCRFNREGTLPTRVLDCCPCGKEAELGVVMAGLRDIAHGLCRAAGAEYGIPQSVIVKGLGDMLAREEV